MRPALNYLLAAVAACLLAAPVSSAASTRYGELSLRAPATPGLHLLPVQRAPFAFDLLGARWPARAGVSVEVRARAIAGPWSAWTRLAADGGGRVSHAEPVWVPGSRLFQVRLRGAVRLHIALVAADRSPQRPLRALEAAPGQPSIISRAGWGADEAIRRAAPRYADAVHMVFVHHTDTPNGYAPGDVPAIIRSIYTYHVRSNGWNDIGYNFLVDAYGRVYEGRAGGVDRPVIGAHTEGFNAGSVGIAVIGNGSLAPLTTEVRDALVNLIAWRLDVAHVDPLGHATMISGGTSRFAAGRSVSLRVVSGHRDANSTDCPGSLIYPALDGIAAAAQATGTPKIVDATATPPGLGTNDTGALVPIVFRARVLGGAGWSVTVLDAHGAPVTSTSGSGTDVNWTWSGTRSDGSIVAPGTPLAYRIEALDAAGEAARPLLGSLGVLPVVAAAPPLSLAPAVISPDGDGVDDSLAIGYTLSSPATVSLDVIAPDGSTVDTLVPGTALPAGGQSARWGGEGLAGIVADGTYTVRLTVTDAAGQVAERSGTVTVVRAIRKLRLSRMAAGRDTPVIVSWQQTAPAAVNGSMGSSHLQPAAALLAGELPAGPQSYTIEAARLAALPDGNYTFTLRAQTAVGEQVLRASFKLDRGAPRARLVGLRVHKRSAFLVVRLSEAMTVRVVAGSRVVVPRRPRGDGLNGFRFRLPAGVPARLRLQLVDRAGNAGRAGPFKKL
ncbi:MAG TPA: N-acetylmuramoyl-L-alanine amidase [Gaiellales bacterium]|nr:N-acetylmuramoyl-L-alanine amidase [Gaiellales bacterium]